MQFKDEFRLLPMSIIMQFKDYPLGWNEIDGLRMEAKTLLLMFPNGKYKLAGYRKNPYGRKNGHYYWCYKDFVTKSLDKLKNHVLNSVRDEAMGIVNFVDGLEK